MILPLEQVDLIMANPPYLAATFFEKVAAITGEWPSEKSGSLENGFGENEKPGRKNAITIIRSVSPLTRILERIARLRITNSMGKKNKLNLV
ncbi:hypothetical protein [Dawidia soli]|uniref:Uncharacterized protein n=1 Tax=Dawidia soli TaxID=2782352 RepID=A0AAP2DBU3_9BACT|nr:hypothetical protein [Dawidia soli]MBT1689148.1 hypothetical protein [Dawidia soli]